jgi:hypothetical protein
MLNLLQGVGAKRGWFLNADPVYLIGKVSLTLQKGASKAGKSR